MTGKTEIDSRTGAATGLTYTEGAADLYPCSSRRASVK